MTERAVVTERLEPNLAVVRLNRPDKRNALDTATLATLTGALEHLGADRALRALVISTTDVTALCAGADVAERLDAAGGVARMSAFTRLYTLIEQFPVPTIAVCVGNCVGAGAEIAVGCDLRVGGDNLGIAWAGARLGVPVGPARLSQLIGVSRAKELVFTGRVVRIAEAEQIGLVHRVAAAGAAEASAVALATEVAGQSADGVRVLKQMFRELDGSAARVSYENELLMNFQRTGTGLPTA
jgi:enoyl-CoA hydratase/carnithine racemase